MLRVVSDFLGEQAKTDLLRSYGCSSLEEFAVENYIAMIDSAGEMMRVDNERVRRTRQRAVLAPGVNPLSNRSMLDASDQDDDTQVYCRRLFIKDRLFIRLCHKIVLVKHAQYSKIG